MVWTVCSVTWACAWRRAAGVLAANPLPALLASAAAAASPALAFWAGSRLSSSFAAAAGEAAALRLFAMGIGLSALVGGVSVALLAPGPGSLGPQVAAAPCSRAALAAGAVIGPVCAAAAVLAFVLMCFALPLAGSTGAALVLLVLSCAALGAAFGEALRLLVAREPAGLSVLAGAALAWVAAGSPSLHTAYAGPPAAVGTETALAVLPTTGAAGLVLWLLASGTPRQERGHSRDVRLRRLPAWPGAAVAVAMARSVLRRPELRLHGATAVALPLAAAIAARLAFGVTGAAATVFCAAVTLTAVALYPPAALGLAGAGRWLLAAAPRRRSSVAAAAAAGGVAAASALVSAAALLAAPLGVPDASVYVELEGSTAFVLGCAAVAGAIVPWHPERVLSQLASYTGVVVAVVAGGLVATRVQAVAPDGPLFALVTGNAVLVLGLAAAAAAWR